MIYKEYPYDYIRTDKSAVCTFKHQCCRTCKADGDYATKFQLKNEEGEFHNL